MNKKNIVFRKIIHELKLKTKINIIISFIKSIINKLIDEKLNNIKEKDIKVLLENSCKVCIHKDVCIFNLDNTPCKKFLNENILK